MKRILLIMLMPTVLAAKDLVLNFERSCYQKYGEEGRERIINSALNQLNNLPGNARLFVRGDDIEEEVNEHNYRDRLWNPLGSSDLVLFGNVDHRLENVIICDEDGAIFDTQDWVNFGVEIAGWASKPIKNTTDFFSVYINESVSYKSICTCEFDSYNIEDIQILDTTPTEERAIALLTHELSHIIGMAHVPIEKPIADYPIMWRVNLNTTGKFQLEDMTEWMRIREYVYYGKDDVFSFEANVEETSNGQIKIKVAFNSPHKYRKEEAEFLVVAEHEDNWYYYVDDVWLPYNGELTGKTIKLNYHNSMEVYKGVPLEATLYWGLRYNDELFYNRDMPLKIGL